MNPESLLRYLPALAGCVFEQRLASGPVTDSWLLSRGKEQFVLRQDRPLSAVLGLDRAAEWLHLGRAFSIGTGPEPIARDLSRGLLATRYLAGGTMPPVALQAPLALTRLGKRLAAIHALPDIAGKRFNPGDTALRYARALDSAAARQAAQEAAELGDRLYADAPWCLCHHDAHAGNIINSSPLSLIDWEYAAPGHPLMDLAVVKQFHSLGPDQVEALIAGWQSRGGGLETAPLNDFCRLYDLLALLWQQVIDR